jgi:hypothetical protein
MENPISRSLPDVSMDSVFTEVHHNEKLGLQNPELRGCVIFCGRLVQG